MILSEKQVGYLAGLMDGCGKVRVLVRNNKVVEGYYTEVTFGAGAVELKVELMGILGKEISVGRRSGGMKVVLPTEVGVEMLRLIHPCLIKRKKLVGLVLELENLKEQHPVKPFESPNETIRHLMAQAYSRIESYKKTGES